MRSRMTIDTKHGMLVVLVYWSYQVLSFPSKGAAQCSCVSSDQPGWKNMKGPQRVKYAEVLVSEYLGHGGLRLER